MWQLQRRYAGEHVLDIHRKVARWPDSEDDAQRSKPAETIAVEGDDELRLLTALVLALHTMNPTARMAELKRRERLSDYQGAEERSRVAHGRSLGDREQEPPHWATRRHLP